MSGDEVVELQDRVPQVRIDPAIVDYILDLVDATRKHEQLHLGLSTRGALALTAAVQASAIVNGREYVLPDDIKDLFIACAAHRVISKTYMGNGDADATHRILQSILDRTPAPK
jgi:MoxR-like ATPase